MLGLVVQRVVSDKRERGIVDWWGVHLGPVLGMGKVAILVPEDSALTWM